MTNTKFRKRALLSSVAMLLVALVALGSATFAWFTEDPTAEAHGIPAYAQTSKGLLISTDTDATYSHHAELSKNLGGIYLSPATTNNGTTYKTIEAELASNFQLDTTKSWSDATVLQHAAGNGVYKETMRLKMSTAPAAATNVTLDGLEITLKNGNHNMKSALMVTLVYNNTFKTFSVSGDDIDKFDSYTTATRTVSTTQLDVTQAAASGLNTVVGAIPTSNSPITVDIYVWLNGQDSSVYTDNSDASQLVDKIQASFSIPA